MEIHHELIRQLQSGTVRQKCEAAEALGRLGGQAVPATDALVAALNDLGEEEVVNYFEGGCGGGMATYYYVRESAVNALAKVNPAAAAPLAIRVMAGLKRKPKSWYVGSPGRYGSEVTFSMQTLGAFISVAAAKGMVCRLWRQCFPKETIH